MVRPIKPRFVRGCPLARYFKPQGIPLRTLEEVILTADELEAIRLYSFENLEQVVAAKKMNISQPTFARILQRAHKKIAQALVQGKAIKIEQKNQLAESFK
jgi:predicted DNA-binding protein (UPF0251 family)